MSPRRHQRLASLCRPDRQYPFPRETTHGPAGAYPYCSWNKSSIWRQLKRLGHGINIGVAAEGFTMKGIIIVVLVCLSSSFVVWPVRAAEPDNYVPFPSVHFAANELSVDVFGFYSERDK